jgi:DNA transformation protein
MAVSNGYLDYVTEQLGKVAPVSTRRMFGGVGIYADEVFIAVIDDDTLFFKVDDTNRPDFEAAGMPPFYPFGDNERPMNYYQVPVDVLEDDDQLGSWVQKAVNVALRAKKPKRKKTQSRK